MTPRITLVTVPVLAALVLVPASLGNGRPVTMQSDVVDRAVAARLASQSDPIVSPDAIDRLQAYQARSQPITAPDAVDRAAAARADYGSNRRFDDRFNSPTNVSTPVTVTHSRDEIEWPQVGIGFLMGILLAGALLVALRLSYVRTLAHR
jgi:hypothetical protein